MHSTTNYLFKFCTTVLISTGLFIGPVFGQTNNNTGNSNNGNQYRSYADLEKDDKTKIDITEAIWSDCIQGEPVDWSPVLSPGAKSGAKKYSQTTCYNIRNSIFGKFNLQPIQIQGLDDCKEAKDAFKKVEDELSDAATKAGAKHAYDDAVKCRDCVRSKTDSLPGYCSDEGRDLDKKNKKESRAVKRSASRLVPGEANSMATDRLDIPLTVFKPPVTNTAIFSCPPIATSVLEKLESKIDKINDKIKEQREGLLTDQEKLQKLQSKFREESVEYQDNVKKIERERIKALKELKTGEEKRLEESQRQMSAIQDQISQIQTIAYPSILEKNRRDTAEAQLVCQGKAYADLDKELAKRGAALQNNTLSAGDFIGLAGLAGSTQREKNSNSVMRSYNICKSGDQYKEAIRKIEADLKIEKAKLEEAIKKLNGEINAIHTEIGKYLGAEYQEKANEIITTTTEALTSLREKHTASLADLNDQIKLLTEKINEDKMIAKQDISNKRQMDTFMARAEANATGDPTETKAKAEFLQKFNDIKSKAETVFSSCGCRPPADKPSGDKATNQNATPECNKAHRVVCTLNDAFENCSGVDTMFSKDFHEEYHRKGQKRTTDDKKTK